MIRIGKCREQMVYEYCDESIGTTYYFRILIGKFSFTIEFTHYDY
jgi:hypothetical protein